MWYPSENSNMTKPPVVDSESSKKYVYVRKDFEEVPEATIEGQTIPAHWKWKEMKVPKEDWAVYEKVIGHDEALDDVYAALTELAELIEEA